MITDYLSYNIQETNRQEGEKMADNNIFSYLKWRGDISLAKKPFNAVDALVLSIFSYLNLPGIVSSGAQTITVAQTAKEYFSPLHPHDDYPYYQHLLHLMSQATRFRQAKLSYFVNLVTKKSQFSALKIRLADGTNFIAFRGTDNSLIGWKEDFEISFHTTQAQKQACSYLTNILAHDRETYLLGGHSKGGNLAEFAALNLKPDLRGRISKIYTFDAPGIAKEVEGNLPQKVLTQKLKRYVPEFSIIGRLFEPSAVKATIVASSRRGLTQHDAFSWEITGSHFITRSHRNPQARIYNQLLKDWIGDKTLPERESLTNDLFSSLAASGANKITELHKYGFGSFGAILFSLAGSSRRTRFVFGSLFSAIWHTLKRLQIPRRLFTIDSIIGWVMVILGITALTAPQYAMRAFGLLVSLTGIGYSSSQILAVAQSKLSKRQKNFFVISWLIIFALSVALISNNQLLIYLAHYLLGVFLIIYSYIRLRQIILHRITGIFRKIIVALESLVAFAVGILVIINPQSFSRRSILIFGILIIVYGFFKLIAEIFNQRRALPTKHR